MLEPELLLQFTSENSVQYVDLLNCNFILEALRLLDEPLDLSYVRYQVLDDRDQAAYFPCLLETMRHLVGGGLGSFGKSISPHHTSDILGHHGGGMPFSRGNLRLGGSQYGIKEDISEPKVGCPAVKPGTENSEVFFLPMKWVEPSF